MSDFLTYSELKPGCWYLSKDNLCHRVFLFHHHDSSRVVYHKCFRKFLFSSLGPTRWHVREGNSFRIYNSTFYNITETEVKKIKASIL